MIPHIKETVRPVSSRHYANILPATYYHKSVSYINPTPEPFWVVERGNVVIPVPPMPNGYMIKDEFIIRTTYSVMGSGEMFKILDSMDHLLLKNDMFDTTHMALKKALREQYNEHSTTGRFCIDVDRHIKIADIHKRGALYEEDTDVVLANQIRMPDVLHPSSPEARSKNITEEYTKDKGVSGVLIELIDNENNIPARYIYCAKRVIEVKPRKCAEMDSGVYITTIENQEDGTETTHTTVLDFEQAEAEIGLSRTREQAFTGGNPEHINEQHDVSVRLERQRLDNDAIKFQADKLKNAQELEDVKHKASKEVDEARAREAQIKEDAARKEAAHKLETMQNEARVKAEAAAREADWRHEMEKRDSKMRKSLEKIKLKASKAKEKLMLKAAKLTKVSEQRKDFYEERSHQRKDTTEVVKFIPSFLAGAAAIFAIFQLVK